MLADVADAAPPVEITGAMSSVPLSVLVARSSLTPQFFSMRRTLALRASVSDLEEVYLL